MSRTAEIAPASSTEMPRELKITQAVFAITALAASRHAGACATATCEFGGGAPMVPALNVSPVASGEMSPSGTQAGAPVFRHCSTWNVPAARLTRTRARVNCADADILAIAIEFDTS